MSSTATTNATTTTATTTTTAATLFKEDFDVAQSWFSNDQSSNLLSVSEPFETNNSFEELHELYKPFFPKSQSLSPQSIISPPTISSFSSIASPREQTSQFKPHHQQQQQHQHQQLIQPKQVSHASTSANPQATRSKRR